MDEPPADPYSGEGWEDCAHCKGTGVEMAAHDFEVYFRFSDEIEAREFMEKAADQFDLPNYGVRRVPPDEFMAMLKGKGD